MDGWKLLLELVGAMAAAMLLGAFFERIKIGAIVGYMLAGFLVGPTVFGIVTSTDTVKSLAELGVALLLFTIGLEFSFFRLKKLGTAILMGGVLQVFLTLVLFTGVGLAFGLQWKTAVAVGAVACVSSTVVVLRLLKDRFELDAPYGKLSLGVLLVQDIALVPLVLMIAFLGGNGIDVSDAGQLASAAGKFIVVSVGFVVAISIGLPRILRTSVMATNRELPILLAVVTCTGAAVVAHSFGVSASLGAFLAGMLLAESKFEEQIRSDVAGLKAMFGTVFFLSIGMLADATWISKNILLVIGVSVLILFLNCLGNFMAFRVLRFTTLTSASAAIVLCQVGELGFVLLQEGINEQLINFELGQLLTASAIVTLILSPLLVTRAPEFARFIAVRITAARKLILEERREESEPMKGHFVVVGMGTAGQNATRILEDAQYEVLAVDIDRRALRIAEELGARTRLADATQTETLMELHLSAAKGLIVALPDPQQAANVVGIAHRLVPDLKIVARSRYHDAVEILKKAGATKVISEEELLGRQMGRTAVQAFGVSDRDIESSA